MTGDHTHHTGDDRIRCFVGIAAADMGLATVLDERISQWRAQPALSEVRWTPKEFLHLTLAFMGAQPREILTPLAGMLDQVVARHASFSVSVTHCSGFPDAKSRILAAMPQPSPALLALQREVANTVADVGISLEDRPYLPHITLGRWGRHGVSSALDEPLLASGQAVAVSLYRSDALPSGSHYTVMARWPLKGA